jgi:hypothetical protein
MNTADIGILIRDRLEGDVVHEHNWDTDPIHTVAEHNVTFVDVSDPDNPVIHVSNGDKFRVIVIHSY